METQGRSLQEAAATAGPVVSLAGGRTIAARASPASSQPTTSVIPSPMAYSVGNPYQFQYERTIDDQLKTPKSPMQSTRKTYLPAIRESRNAPRSAASMLVTSSVTNCRGLIGSPPPALITK